MSETINIMTIYIMTINIMNSNRNLCVPDTQII